MRVYRLDEKLDLELVDSDSFGSAGRILRTVDVPKQSVVLVEFSFR